MTIRSPIDIHDKQFNVKMRGYDQDEVNDFLDQIIQDFSDLIKRNESLSADLKAAQAQVDEFQGMKEALNKSLILAQDAADNVKQNAQSDADAIIARAQKNADQLANDAKAHHDQVVGRAADDARRYQIEADDAKRNVQEFRQHMKMLLEAELEAIGGAEWNQTVGAPIDQPVPASAENKLDNEGPAPVESSSNGSDNGVTEIVFPDEPIK